MEITTNLPLNEWYRESEHNHKGYWPLDYPPLCAYFHWMLGSVASVVEPSSVVLGASKGYTSNSFLLFMRLSVIIVELLIYAPPLVLLMRSLYFKFNGAVRVLLYFLVLNAPPLLLIDHGHFQYNCVMLGFFLWGVYFALNDMPEIAAVAMVLSVNFKQMSLYYGLPFVVFVLARIIRKHVSFPREESLAMYMQRLFEIGMQIGTIALAGLVVMTILWVPLLGESNPLQVRS